ncbi:hypothetical protein D7X55_29510 [Corallococcus sp. AB049A]|uniref:Uncharacterized protein n=1 Tax=Corallococcus interemptor TaxID=2316720 RepID=A0A3A8QY41_9BACT|nr:MULTISPECIES: hypothetical protein [Corallococcus]RKH48636.1 hypothetical protein D7Y23_19550 [Corallococcus sp. AB050B]RKH69762.1 hypothetical protein D7X96_14110 [Corallococcus interemptor]RKI55326.1 hypothetical protein D7X55_29510 [Corallococcus sp. AB049A]
MKSIIGWALAAFGVIGFGIEIDKLISGTAENTVSGLIIAAVFILGGLALVRSARRAKLPPELRDAPVMRPALDSRGVERAVLACAQTHGGRVTIAEVAAGTQLSFTEAKEVLEELSRAGACTVDVTENGAFIYEFSGLMPRAASKA